MNLEMIPLKYRATFYLRAFGLLKIPMIYFIQPTVLELTDERCVVKVPLTWRTRNHLKSMYFGVLCAAADCSGGLIAMQLIQKEGNKISLVFKDFKAEFLKRAEDDVIFTCEDGKGIRELIDRTMSSGERENMPVYVTATVPTKTGDEPVAKFVLTLSLKRKDISKDKA